MRFINQIVMEGVVADQSALYNSLKGRKAYTILWHKTNNQEMLVKAISSKLLRQAFLELEKGDIVTFYGYVIFIDRQTKNTKPFPVIIVDRMRVLETDRSLGLGLLEEADLKDLIDVKKLKLPWEKEQAIFRIFVAMSEKGRTARYYATGTTKKGGKRKPAVAKRAKAVKAKLTNKLNKDPKRKKKNNESARKRRAYVKKNGKGSLKGKDYDHKQGKFMKASKNRGQKEASRKKGSKRKKK